VVQVDTVVLVYEILAYYLIGIILMFSFLAFSLDKDETIADVFGALLAASVWPLVIFLAIIEFNRQK
jgi:hypothetical protein